MLFRGNPRDFVDIEQHVPWATVSSDSRGIVLEFKSEAGFRQFFAVIDAVDEDMWRGAILRWALRVRWGNTVGHLRPSVRIPYVETAAVAAALISRNSAKVLANSWSLAASADLRSGSFRPAPIGSTSGSSGSRRPRSPATPSR